MGKNRSPLSSPSPPKRNNPSILKDFISKIPKLRRHHHRKIFVLMSEDALIKSPNCKVKPEADIKTRPESGSKARAV